MCDLLRQITDIPLPRLWADRNTDALLCVFSPNTDNLRTELRTRARDLLQSGYALQSAGQAREGLGNLEEEARAGVVQKEAGLLVAVIVAANEPPPQSLRDFAPRWLPPGASNRFIVLRLLPHLPQAVAAWEYRTADADAEYIIGSSDYDAMIWTLFMSRRRVDRFNADIFPRSGCHIVQAKAWSTAQQSLHNRLLAKLTQDLSGSPDNRGERAAALSKLMRETRDGWLRMVEAKTPLPKAELLPVNENNFQTIQLAPPPKKIGWLGSKSSERGGDAAEQGVALYGVLRDLFGVAGEELRIRANIDDYARAAATDTETFRNCWPGNNRFRFFPLHNLTQLDDLCRREEDRARAGREQAEESWKRFVSDGKYRLKSKLVQDWDESWQATDTKLRELAQALLAETFWRKALEMARGDAGTDWSNAVRNIERQRSIIIHNTQAEAGGNLNGGTDWMKNIEGAMNEYRRPEDNRDWTEGSLNEHLREFNPPGVNAVILEQLARVCLFVDAGLQLAWGGVQCAAATTRPIPLPGIGKHVMYALCLTPLSFFTGMAQGATGE